MGEGGFWIKTRVFKFVNCVYAVWKDLLFNILHIVAGNHSLEFDPEFVGELTSFGKKLQANVGDFAVFIFAIDDKIIFVCHEFRCFLLLILGEHNPEIIRISR